jgi:hypothetical protein
MQHNTGRKPILLIYKEVISTEKDMKIKGQRKSEENKIYKNAKRILPDSHFFYNYRCEKRCKAINNVQNSESS